MPSAHVVRRALAEHVLAGVAVGRAALATPRVEVLDDTDGGTATAARVPLYDAFGDEGGEDALSLLAPDAEERRQRAGGDRRDLAAAVAVGSIEDDDQR